MEIFNDIFILLHFVTFSTPREIDLETLFSQDSDDHDHDMASTEELERQLDTEVPESKELRCGVDATPSSVSAVVNDGDSLIENYPWLGLLFYPVGKEKIYTTGVVLVTRQFVIAAALEIDYMPKDDFRATAKVVLGSSCSGQRIPVRDYNYHPEFRRDSHSAIAIILLDLDEVNIDLQPICPPPTHFVDPQFFAITVPEDCASPYVKIYTMEFVDQLECSKYYRRSGLDMDSFWPKHSTCARARSGEHCIWRSGTLLTMKEGSRWRLLGFGVYGPGCRSPSRFLDYGKYYGWVHSNVARLGRPSITRIRPDMVIMRRSLSNLQRFGQCDVEEMQVELFSETTTVTGVDTNKPSKLRYNVSLYHEVEYSCITFNMGQRIDITIPEQPYVRLKRWCLGPTAMCFDYHLIQIDFFVEISYSGPVTFIMRAFGKQVQVIQPALALVLKNQDVEKPLIPNITQVSDMGGGGFTWFVKDRRTGSFLNYFFPDTPDNSSSALILTEEKPSAYGGFDLRVEASPRNITVLKPSELI